MENRIKTFKLNENKFYLKTKQIKYKTKFSLKNFLLKEINKLNFNIKSEV